MMASEIEDRSSEIRSSQTPVGLRAMRLNAAANAPHLKPASRLSHLNSQLFALPYRPED